MLIFNDVDIIEKYIENDIKILGIETIDCTINNEFIWIGGVKPVTKLSYSNGAIKLVLLFEGNTNDIGRLIAEISEGTLLHRETHKNIVTITNYEHKRIVEDVYEISIEYSASFKVLEEVKRVIDADINFEYEGTVETPLDILIKPLSSATDCSFIINDTIIAFNNISGSDYIEILGNKIMVNGANGFSKCNLNKFPKLIKGNNVIGLDNCTLEIIYKPLML